MVSTLPFIAKFILISSCFFFVHPKPSTSISFSTNIIHINSVRSLFHKPSITRHEQIQDALHRSYARKRHILAIQSKVFFPADISASTWHEVSEYMMEYYIGKSKPVRSYGIIDTGSDITWLQCKPCEGCQNQSIPMFDPRKSSSYLPLTCDETACKKEPSHQCSKDNICQYEVGYGDGSYTKGNLAYETLHFPDNNRTIGNFTWDSVVIGCGDDNRDTTSGNIVPPGIVALGLSPLSLVQQSAIKRFAYCFGNQEDIHAEGYIKFGEAASFHGNHTPISSPSKNDNYYYLNLEGISVGDTRLPIPNDTFNFKDEIGTGGFIIDSGTAYTFLNTTAFNILADELEKRLAKQSSAYSYFSRCNKGMESDFLYGPVITFHFKNADFKISPKNIWEKIKEGMYCLAILPDNQLSVFGNYQQQNAEVGFDVQNSVTYFNSESSCNK